MLPCDKTKNEGSKVINSVFNFILTHGSTYSEGINYFTQSKILRGIGLFYKQLFWLLQTVKVHCNVTSIP